jgi:hypothetical protein
MQHWLTTYYHTDFLLFITQDKLTEMLESDDYTDQEKQRLSDNAVFITKDDGQFYDIPLDLEEKFNLHEGINLKIDKSYNQLWSKDAFIARCKYADPATWSSSTVIQLYLNREEK